MAAQESVQAKPAGVSPARKAVSAIILVIALVVLGVELRAGLGQKQTIDAMALQAEEGVFKDVKLGDAKAMLVLFPSETVIRDSEMETLYKYQWNSLLRPLMGQTNPELYLVASKSEPAYAISYYTDPDDGSEGFFGDNGAPGGIREELPGDPSGASMGGGGRPGMNGPPGGMPGMPGMSGMGSGRGSGGPGGPVPDNPIPNDSPADAPRSDADATPAAGDKPADPPTGDKPAEEKPTDPPAGDKPADEKPAADAPAADPPAAGEAIPTEPATPDPAANGGDAPKSAE